MFGFKLKNLAGAQRRTSVTVLIHVPADGRTSVKINSAHWIHTQVTSVCLENFISEAQESEWTTQSSE